MEERKKKTNVAPLVPARGLAHGRHDANSLGGNIVE